MKIILRRNSKLKYRVVWIIAVCTIFYILFSRQSGEKIELGKTTCQYNFLGCSKGKNSSRNIGLLLTKDDGKILETWFKQNSRFFSALVVLDGSLSSNLASTLFSKCENVYYFHESNFSTLKEFSDGELRALGYKLVTDIFGLGIWITMAHTDEFYVHSPLKIIDLAEKEKADFVRWRALHVLPHPSEYENYKNHRNAPVTELFRHYYHYGPGKGSFLESRMFRSSAKLYWDHKQGSILPLNLKKEISVHPAYMHYKVHNLSLDAYTTEGVHKQHWDHVSSRAYLNPNSKLGVGIRWKVQNERDFFVDHFPNSKKYNYVSKFENNMIESYLDVGEIFKDNHACM